jgi:anti-anti-sigma factor
MSQSPQALSPRVEEGTDGVVVRFTGGSFALTKGNALVLAGLLRRLAPEVGGRELVLDFGNVAFVSSAGLDVLIGLQNRLRAVGKRLALRDLDDAVYEVFESTRLTTLFDIRRAGPGQPLAGRPDRG